MAERAKLVTFSQINIYAYAGVNMIVGIYAWLPIALDVSPHDGLRYASDDKNVWKAFDHASHGAIPLPGKIGDTCKPPSS